MKLSTLSFEMKIRKTRGRGRGSPRTKQLRFRAAFRRALLVDESVVELLDLVELRRVVRWELRHELAIRT